MNGQKEVAEEQAEKGVPPAWTNGRTGGVQSWEAGAKQKAVVVWRHAEPRGALQLRNVKLK
jgi:hypothetical protein